MDKSIKKRVELLQACYNSPSMVLLVRLPTGEQREATASEWAKNADEWDFIRVLRGASLDDLSIMLDAAWDIAGKME